MWTKCNHAYFVNYKIEVFENDVLIRVEHLSLENERVYIAIESKALGDTLAWIPYCEEFRKKHNCKLIVSCWNRDIFEMEYPEIQFVDAGTSVMDIKALYRIGWYYSEDGNTLFYASSGKPGLGGLDVFQIDLTKDADAVNAAGQKIQDQLSKITASFSTTPSSLNLQLYEYLYQFFKYLSRVQYD